MRKTATKGPKTSKTLEKPSQLAHMKLSSGEKSARTRKKNVIRKQLEQQVRDRGMDGAIWQDRIEVYLRYWEIEQDLLLDIKIRGPNIMWDNGGGQCGVKKNDSLSQLPKVSKEMRDMLAFLNVKVVEPSECGGNDDANL